MENALAKLKLLREIEMMLDTTQSMLTGVRDDEDADKPVRFIRQEL